MYWLIVYNFYIQGFCLTFTLIFKLGFLQQKSTFSKVFIVSFCDGYNR